MKGAKECPQAGSEPARGAEETPCDIDPSASSDTKQALGFIKHHASGWLPAWYVQIAAIDPDSGAYDHENAHPGQLDTLLPFIERYNGKRNLYFGVDPLIRDVGKASKADVAALCYWHVDYDPRDNEPLNAERVRMRGAVDTFKVKPTSVIDSGNGLGLFWRSGEPILHNDNTEALEATNKRLAKAFDGDSGTDLCRLMRLPGTLNLPTASKLAKGRSAVPVPATLVYQNDNAYSLEDFDFLPAVAEKAKAVMPPTSIGTPIRLDDYGLEPDQAALVAGTLPKGQRNEAMHKLLIDLLNDGHPRDNVLATLHEGPGLVDYFTSKHPGDPEAFALFELGKAWAKSWPGILARLAPYNPAWTQLDAVTIRAFAGIPIPFEKSRLATAIRFDARPTTLDELDKEDPPQEYVIEPIYPLEVPGEFAGAHGIGKSINGVEQCCCVATKRPWQGLKVKQGKVVFASWEDPRPQIMRRVKTWLRNIKDPKERAKAKRAIAENLIILGCDEIDLMLTTKSFGACSARDEVIELIAERCQGAILVMLETAALMHGGDELNEDLAQLAKAVKLITNATGAAVITVRHVSKDAARNRTVDAYVGRGGGSFTGAMRTMVVLVDVDAEVVRKKGIGLGDAAVAIGRPVLAYHHVKANYGEKMREPVYLVVMPDGHMERIAGPNERQAQSDMLLEWLRDNMEDDGLAFTTIRNARKDYGNPQQGVVRLLLECLKNDGRVKCRKVPGRGRTGEVEKWELVKPA